jgi:curved DNA-binding protein CbpA
MQQPNMKKHYYSIWGAAKTASQEEIERLYKRCAMLEHDSSTFVSSFSTTARYGA